MSAQVADFTVRVVSRVCEESVIDDIVNQSRFALIDPSITSLISLLDNTYFPPAHGVGRLYYQITSVVGSKSAGLIITDGVLVFELLETSVLIRTASGVPRTPGPGALAVRGFPPIGLRYNIGRMSVAFDLARNSIGVYVFISFGGISYGYRSSCGRGIPVQLRPLLDLLAEAYEQRARQPPASAAVSPPQWWGLPGAVPQPPVTPGSYVAQTAREVATLPSFTYMTEAELREMIRSREVLGRLASSAAKSFVYAMCKEYWQSKPENAFRLHVISGSVVECLFGHTDGKAYLCRYDQYGQSPYCFVSKAISHLAYYGYATATELFGDIDSRGPAYYALEAVLKRGRKYGITFDRLAKGISRTEFERAERDIDKVMADTEKACSVKIGDSRTKVAISAFVIGRMLKDLADQTISVDEIMNTYVESGYLATMKLFISSIDRNVKDSDVIDFMHYVLSTAQSAFARYTGKESGVIAASVAGTVEPITLSKIQLCTTLGIASAYPI